MHCFIRTDDQVWIHGTCGGEVYTRTPRQVLWCDRCNQTFNFPVSVSDPIVVPGDNPVPRDVPKSCSKYRGTGTHTDVGHRYGKH